MERLRILMSIISEEMLRTFCSKKKLRRNAENILQQKKTDDGLKMNILFKGLEERGKFIFKRKVEIIANVGKRHFLIKFRHDNSPFG